jgi:hypothetical protein
VTVELSDSDYAVLRRVAEWLQQHAGIDAPEYPDIEIVMRVVDNIARRRQPDSSKERSRSVVSGGPVDIGPATREDDVR